METPPARASDRARDQRRPRWLGLAIPPILVAGVVVLSWLSRLEGQLVWRDASPEELATAANPHSEGGRPLCPACHAGPGRALRADPVATCTACHSFAHGNHPVDVVQRAPIDAPLPLGEGGRVLCHTCHEVHDLEKHEDGLRMPRTALCKACHPGH